MRALRDAMERHGGEVSRIELIAAFRIATRTRLADASAIGAWHVFGGERLTDDDLDAELVEAMRRHV